MKNIVITGSTRGIGLCMAKEFLKNGCNVTISGRSDKNFEKLKADLFKYEKQITFSVCDVRDIKQLENLWSKAFEKWGSVDCWINNAGMNSTHEYLYNTDQCYIDRVIDTNIKGVVYGSKVAAQNMLEQGYGQIWNMEGLGSNNMIQSKTILYGTSKHALTYFTKGLAKELENTNVLAGRLSPGMMLTEFITKTPDGKDSEVVSEKDFKKIFNILADRPETVAEYFIPRIIKNNKNNKQIAWLTNSKVIWRFLSSIFIKRRLIK